jgi:hypothetical protein
MSAMGDRLLLLENTADELAAVDPDLARRFRQANGLPVADRPDVGPGGHMASVDETPEGIRVACSCGRWNAEVGWDRIDELVVEAREHFGSEGGGVADAEPASGHRWVS